MGEFTNWAVLLSAAGVIQGIFLVLIIMVLGNRASQSANIFLSGFVLSLSLFIMFPILEETITGRVPKIACIIDPMIFLIGPFIYFYFESLWRQVSLREFIPHTLVFLSYAIWLYIFLAWFYQPVDLANFKPGIQFWTIGSLKFGHLFYYLYKGKKSLDRLKENGEKVFSDFERVGIIWGEQILYGMIIIVYSAVLLYFFAIWHSSYSVEIDYLVIAMFTPYIYYVSYLGITKSILHSKNLTPLEIQQKESNENTEISRGENQGDLRKIPFYVEREISSKLEKVIKEEKLYTNPELSLEDLASACNCSLHHMSYYLNTVLRQSFYDFINNHRVEWVKRELINPQNRHLSILAIAMDAGFNSKTAFNTVFKKVTGYTPSQYKAARVSSQYVSSGSKL